MQPIKVLNFVVRVLVVVVRNVPHPLVDHVLQDPSSPHDLQLSRTDEKESLLEGRGAESALVIARQHLPPDGLAWKVGLG